RRSAYGDRPRRSDPAPRSLTQTLRFARHVHPRDRHSPDLGDEIRGRQGWCPEPRLILPRTSQGRTIFLMPAQAERLVAAASDRLKPLVIFLLGTGARAGEALALEWQDVDLVGRRAIFWQTKSGKRRNVELPSRVVAAL